MDIFSGKIIVDPVYDSSVKTEGVIHVAYISEGVVTKMCLHIIVHHGNSKTDLCFRSLIPGDLKHKNINS